MMVILLFLLPVTCYESVIPSYVTLQYVFLAGEGRVIEPGHIVLSVVNTARCLCSGKPQV